VLDADTLTTLAMACRCEERVRFSYLSRASEPSDRTVEPHRLVALGRRWYLVAWDLDRADWRTFRLDRVSAPALTAARFRPREIPGGDPVAWLRSRIAAIPRGYDVVVRFQIGAPAVAAFVGHWATVEPIDETSCRMRMNAEDLSWPIWILGALNADFTVESPPELLDRIREAAATLLRGIDATTSESVSRA
jgi:predicted DNA-binding transcriptional regulator YafY